MTALRPSTPDHVPYYVKGLALGIPPYLVAIHFWTWVFSLPTFLSGRADFRQLYAAAYMVRTGHARQLYDYAAQKHFQDVLVSRAELALPFVSPAYHALVFSPLSWFSYRHAYFVFLTINCLALGVSFSLLRPWMHDLHKVFSWLPCAIFLGFLPIGAALIQGQDSVILLALATGTFVLLVRGNEVTAGALMGLGLFKLQIILPIALLFLFWRRIRFLLGFAATGAVVFAISVSLTGVVQTMSYLSSLLSIAGLKPADSALALYPVSLQSMANIHGFVFGMLRGFASGAWINVFTVAASALVFVWTTVRGAHARDSANLLLLAIPCGVLIGHHTYIHDLSILLLPVVAMLGSFLHCETEARGSGQAIARLAAIGFVAPVTESFFPEHFYLVCGAVICLLVATALSSKIGISRLTRA